MKQISLTSTEDVLNELPTNLKNEINILNESIDLLATKIKE